MDDITVIQEVKGIGTFQNGRLVKIESQHRGNYLGHQISMDGDKYLIDGRNPQDSLESAMTLIDAIERR